MLGLFFFGFFSRPGTLLAPFGLDLGRSGARFWKAFGVDFQRFLEVFGDKLGLRLVLENLRLLLENLVFRSILLASGSGWAGGFTRSAKNLRRGLEPPPSAPLTQDSRIIFSLLNLCLGSPPPKLHIFEYSRPFAKQNTMFIINIETISHKP